MAELPVLHIVAESSRAERDVELLSLFCGSSQAAASLVRERYAEAGEETDKVFEFETENVSAPGALKNILHLQLRKPLRDLAAAVRAGDYGNFVV